MTDGNSAVNQGIKGQFVQREVVTCFSYEMDAVLKASTERTDDLPSFDSIENMYEYRCPDCGEGYQMENGALWCCIEVPDKCPHCNEGLPDKEDFLNNHGGTCPDCDQVVNDLEMLSDLDSEPQEVFEWWIVTEYLYDKLKARGCVVLEWGNNYYWGRCCSGQAILLDGVITDICRRMEILAGQRNSWEKK